jgi:hypothetical protein
VRFTCVDRHRADTLGDLLCKRPSFRSEEPISVDLAKPRAGRANISLVAKDKWRVAERREIGFTIG